MYLDLIGIYIEKVYCNIFLSRKTKESGRSYPSWGWVSDQKRWREEKLILLLAHSFAIEEPFRTKVGKGRERKTGSENRSTATSTLEGIESLSHGFVYTYAYMYVYMYIHKYTQINLNTLDHLD